MADSNGLGLITIWGKEMRIFFEGLSVPLNSSLQSAASLQP